MKEFAQKLCKYLIATYGDLAFVTPETFAAALRMVGQIPDDASPTYIRYWIAGHVKVHWETAPPSLPGFNYEEAGVSTIETGRGRGSVETNLTIPHEFGECLQRSVDAELAERGLPPLGWGEREWERMSLDFVAPISGFKRVARETGLDLTAFQRNLSFSAVVYRMKEAFDRDLPLVALYYGNSSHWVRGKGFLGNDWRVRASAWTRLWMRYSYAGRDELLRIPRKGDCCSGMSLIDEARHRKRALLVHTLDKFDRRVVEALILIRPRLYGPEPAQVLVIGVEASYGQLLQPQIALVQPEERQATFAKLFWEVTG